MAFLTWLALWVVYVNVAQSIEPSTEAHVGTRFQYFDGSSSLTSPSITSFWIPGTELLTNVLFNPPASTITTPHIPICCLTCETVCPMYTSRSSSLSNHTEPKPTQSSTRSEFLPSEASTGISSTSKETFTSRAISTPQDTCNKTNLSASSFANSVTPPSASIPTKTLLSSDALSSLSQRSTSATGSMKSNAGSASPALTSLSNDSSPRLTSNAAPCTDETLSAWITPSVVISTAIPTSSTGDSDTWPAPSLTSPARPQTTMTLSLPGTTMFVTIPANFSDLNNPTLTATLLTSVSTPVASTNREETLTSPTMTLFTITQGPRTSPTTIIASFVTSLCSTTILASSYNDLSSSWLTLPTPSTASMCIVEACHESACYFSTTYGPIGADLTAFSATAASQISSKTTFQSNETMATTPVTIAITSMVTHSTSEATETLTMVSIPTASVQTASIAFNTSTEVKSTVSAGSASDDTELPASTASPLPTSSQSSYIPPEPPYMNVSSSYDAASSNSVPLHSVSTITFCVDSFLGIAPCPAVSAASSCLCPNTPAMADSTPVTALSSPTIFDTQTTVTNARSSSPALSTRLSSTRTISLTITVSGIPTISSSHPYETGTSVSAAAGSDNCTSSFLPATTASTAAGGKSTTPTTIASGAAKSVLTSSTSTLLSLDLSLSLPSATTPVSSTSADTAWLTWTTLSTSYKSDEEGGVDKSAVSISTVRRWKRGNQATDSRNGYCIST